MPSWLAAEALWVDGGIALIVLAGIAALVSYRIPSARGFALAGALPPALLMLLAGLALRWQQSGQGPFLTLYEVLVSNLLTLGLFLLVAFALVPAARAAAQIGLPVLALFALWALSTPREITPLPPTFDNPWLWVHVIAGKLFLGACLVAAALALRLSLTASSARGQDNTVRELDVTVWRFAALAFVFDSLMLVAGAAWANDAWGRYWNWDPLETWAFLTWLALAIVLHARLAWRLPQWLPWAGICVVFVLAVLTFFGVPFFSLAPHKGLI